MKTKSITLFEYKTSESDDKRIINLINRIRKLNKSYFKNSDGETGFFSLISKNRIKANKYVGLIQIGNQTIQVLPKILKNKDENKYDESFITKNLLYMLNYVKKLDIKETDIASLKQINELFEIIIWLFAKNLLELLKKEIYRTYELKENNKIFLKGKLLIKEQIKYNSINKAKFYCQYDDFLDDNLLNQIFKVTVMKLLRFTNSYRNYKVLSDCAFILQDITLRRRLTLKECNKVKFNRLNKLYEGNFKLAKLLLFGNSTELNSASIDSYSIMFDMNLLFEEFIGEFIKRNFKDIKVETQKSNKYVFNEVIGSNFSKFNLKPDIFIKINNRIVIIDTKYKELKKDVLNCNIPPSDIYQMVMYGMRYFSSSKENEFYNNKEIILLYPEYDFNVNQENIKLKTEENIIIKIKTINLHRDLTNRSEIKNLKEEIKNIIFI